MQNPKDCVLYSGGATGTEEFFGITAEQYGLEEVNYSFAGHQPVRQRGIKNLGPEELSLKDVSLAYVSKLMSREYTGRPCSAACCSPSAGRCPAARKFSWWA